MKWRPAYQYDTFKQPMVCDCCLRAIEPLWTYQHRGFCIRKVFDMGKLILHPGWWGFCADCHRLYLDREIEALIVRVRCLNPAVSVPDVDTLYRLLPEVIYGECVTWTPGNPRFFPIPATLVREDDEA